LLAVALAACDDRAVKPADADPPRFVERRVDPRQPVPGTPPLRITRSFSPVHNIGHFRFLECSHRSDDGVPSGEIAIWDDIYFPFDPNLAKHPDLQRESVIHAPKAHLQQIQESYECDASGSIAVTIANRSAGHLQQILAPALGDLGRSRMTVGRN
jgi:hypothetical protein